MFIEIGIGVAGTLASEFLLAHAFMWFENRKVAKLAANQANSAVILATVVANTQANSSAGILSTIVADAKAVPAWIKKEAVTLEGDVEALLHKFVTTSNTVVTTSNVVASGSSIGATTGVITTPVPPITLGATETVTVTPAVANVSAQTVTFQ